MKYIAVGHVRHRGQVLKKGEILPEATKEEIKYLSERGAIRAIAPSGEVVDDFEEEIEEDSTEEEYSEETEDESEEYEVNEPLEIDAMEGVVNSRRRRGGKS